jgi:hypothetical protein
VLPERVAIRAVNILGIGVVPVIPIQQEEISDDLNAGTWGPQSGVPEELALLVPATQVR